MTSAVDVSELSPYAQKIVAELHSVHPEWRDLGRIETSGKGDKILMIEISAPAEVDAHPLWIDIAKDEFSLGFDACHEHFQNFLPLDPAYIDPRTSIMGSGGSLLEEILSEQTTSVSWWDNEKCKATGFYPPNDPLKTSFPIQHTKIRIRSWRGTYNKDILLN